MKHTLKRTITVLLALCLAVGLAVPGFAAVSYMPDVTPEMSSADYWAALDGDADRVLMTREEIGARNAAAALASGTMVVDMHDVPDAFDGVERSAAIKASAKADAEYYFGWIYDNYGKLADWDYFQKMIDNCADPNARRNQSVRLGIVTQRATLKTFPSENLLPDDPSDADFGYRDLTSLRVNEPLWLYTASRDGKYYLARCSCCSGWVKAEDVALCRDKEEWLSAWDIPADEVLVVTGNKVYTDASNSHPATAKRMLTLGTVLRSVDPADVEGLVNNRSAFHNYIVEMPLRDAKGYYQKSLALIPETAQVSEGYPALTKRNIAKIILSNLGDAYGWGGMLDVEDCSGLVRLTYECFGLSVARNTTWQCNMPVPKISMVNMSAEEKCLMLDKLPLGTALTFNGHEMMYLGKVDGKYFVVSTVSSLMDPYDTSKRLRTRDVMINTLDIRRANGMTWLQALDQATLIGFADDTALPQLRWYHDAVAYCLENDVLSAKKDGYFGLNDAVTRAEAADALWRMAGKPEAETELSFTDAADNTAVLWAAESGVMVGYGGDAFGAEDALTREQLAVILCRFAAQQGLDVSAEDAGALRVFRDGRSVSAFAVPAMQWACAVGILNGSSGRLMPRSGLTRVQLAVVLQQYEGVKTAAEVQLAEAEEAAAE